MNSNNEITYGDDVSFTTANGAPSLITLPATSVTGSSAQLNGNVTRDNGLAVDERRFDWGTTIDGVWPSTNWTNQVTVSGGHFSFNLAGLSPNTIYYFRAWAHNSLGWTNGGIVAFLVPGNLHVVAWGENYRGESTIPDGLSNVVAIAAGDRHSLALQSDGTVVAWGAGTTNTNSDGNYGQSLVPTGLINVVAIAAGGDHSLALKSDGTVVSWGASTVSDRPGSY